MRRVAVAVCTVGLLAAGAVTASPPRADAGGSDNGIPAPTTTVVHDDESDVVGVGFGQPPTQQPDEPGDGTSGSGSGGGGSTPTTLPNDCHEGWWRNPTTGQIDTWIDPVSGNIMAQWQISCPHILVLTDRTYRAPTPADLIPGFYGAVIARIQPPSSAINPPEQAPINLGLWLATAGPTEIAEMGTIGPFQVSVSARLTSTTFDMGDGTVVRCEAGGVPISDLETIEEGPCGHTYRTDLPEGAAIAISEVWEITYDTTLGSGALPPINTESSVPYQTYEIQTIGGPAPTD